MLAKPGLDGHDRGIKLIVHYLMSAGIEVIYLGLFQTVDAIVNTAVQEDVDAIGLSTLDGGHTLIAKDIMELLEENNSSHIPVIFGGIIPEGDISVLKELGVRAVFTPGTPMEEIINYFQCNVS